MIITSSPESVVVIHYTKIKHGNDKVHERWRERGYL
jgi:hypothetical protein